MAEQSLDFGPFQLFPARAVLLRGGAPVRLSSRALAILTVLAQRGGNVVGSAELMARVWPGAVVDAITLRVHLAALRKALRGGPGGVNYIGNVSGRGYRLAVPVASVAPAAGAAGPALPPAPITRLIGRDQAVAAVLRELPRRRLVTLVGSGGIGKTSVALAAVQRLAADCPDGAGFVDLTALPAAADAAAVAAALAAALGLTPGTRPEAALLDHLDGRDMAIVLDNCEHVVGRAAALAETLLKRCAGIHLLATSREPLGAEGEWLYRLAPLELAPHSAAAFGAQAVLAYPSALLFMERARAALDRFTLNDADAPLLAALCRRLDGLPLAIELAAARVDLFDLPGLAAQLDDSLAFLTRSRRTAQARHRTLRATLDWSHDLLPDGERVLLRRLSVFEAAFTPAAAVAVAVDEESDLDVDLDVDVESDLDVNEESDLGMSIGMDVDLRDHAPLDAAAVLAGLENLAAKSLLTVAAGSGYRLPVITRAYAAERLAVAGDGCDSRRRHARWLLAALAQLGPQAGDGVCHGDARALMEDLRAALDWCFANDEAALGTALAATAAPLWQRPAIAPLSASRSAA